MDKVTISVTDAARNFAECVNRVRYQDVTFVLLKNGTPVAQLVPSEQKTCTGREFAELLDHIKLSPDEAKSWQRDLRVARKSLKAPEDKWR